MRTLNDTLGITSILVAHEFAAVARVVDHVYLIAGGKIAAQGTPAELARGDSPGPSSSSAAKRTGPCRSTIPRATTALDLGFPASSP